MIFGRLATSMVTFCREFDLFDQIRVDALLALTPLLAYTHPPTQPSLRHPSWLILPHWVGGIRRSQEGGLGCGVNPNEGGEEGGLGGWVGVRRWVGGWGNRRARTGGTQPGNPQPQRCKKPNKKPLGKAS